MNATPPLINCDNIYTTSNISKIYLNRILGPYTKWLSPARVATTVNITLQGLQIIDSIQTVNNDRVLVKNQTDSVNNGVYIVRNGNWIRAYDLPNGTKSSGIIIYVKQGTINKEYIFYNTYENYEAIVGQDSITISIFNNSDTTTSGVLNSILFKSSSGFIGYESLLYTENDDNCTMTIGLEDDSSNITIQTNATNNFSITTNTDMDMYIKTGNETDPSGDITFQTGNFEDLVGNGGDITITTGNSITVSDTVAGKIEIITSDGDRSGDIILQTGISTGTNQSNITLVNKAATVDDFDDVYYNGTIFETSGFNPIYFKYNKIQLPFINSTGSNWDDFCTINARQGIVTITNPTLSAGVNKQYFVFNSISKSVDIKRLSLISYSGTGIPIFFERPAIDGYVHFYVRSATGTGLSNSPLIFSFVLL